MRAVVMRAGALVVDDITEPAPGPGQALVEVLACGICGSDLHALAHTDDFAETAAISGDALFRFRPERDLVMGHEMCTRVLDVHPSVSSVRTGDVLVGMPIVVEADGVHCIGYTNDHNGGFAERMVITADVAIHVPDGVDPRHAALADPIAVGINGVWRSRAEAGRAAYVAGCGPIGLGTILALRRAGLGPIIAADHSPLRRRLAEHCGADEVLDPGAIDLASAMGRLPTSATAPPVLFDCVGVPGLIDQFIVAAPRRSTVVVLGACMPPDRFRPMLAQWRDLTFEFVLSGPPDSYDRALAIVADAPVDLEPLITATVGLDGVAQAFRDLADPAQHCKIIVCPTAA